MIEVFPLQGHKIYVFCWKERGVVNFPEGGTVWLDISFHFGYNEEAGTDLPHFKLLFLEKKN